MVNQIYVFVYSRAFLLRCCHCRGRVCDDVFVVVVYDSFLR